MIKGLKPITYETSLTKIGKTHFVFSNIDDLDRV